MGLIDKLICRFVDAIETRVMEQLAESLANEALNFIMSLDSDLSVVQRQLGIDEHHIYRTFNGVAWIRPEVIERSIYSTHLDLDLYTNYSNYNEDGPDTYELYHLHRKDLLYALVNYQDELQRIKDRIHTLYTKNESYK